MAEVVSASAGSAVLTAWALHLQASPFVIGVIVSLSQVAQLIQIPAAWLTATFGARKTALIAVAASRQILAPLIFLPFLHVASGTQQSLLLAIAGISALLSVVGNNAWVAWMGDLVPQRIRGRYFGRRTAICTAANALGSLASGALLDAARAHRVEHWALSILALVAILAGASTTWLMWLQGQTHAAHQPQRIRLSSVLAPWRDKSVRALLAYQVTWNISVGFAGTFFTLFMLQDLRMGFTLVAMHGAVTAIARVSAAPMWGRLIDRFGARPVLLFCSAAIALLPLIWLFASPECRWVVWLDPPLSGLLWGGQAQAIFQLPLTVAPRNERPFYLAAFAMAAGVAFAVATSLGGACATRWAGGMDVAGHHLVGYQLLFALSAVARGFSALLARHIVEPGARSVWAMVGRPPPAAWPSQTAAES